MSKPQDGNLLITLAVLAGVIIFFFQASLIGHAFAAPLIQSRVCAFVNPNGPNPYSDSTQCVAYAWSRRPDLPWFAGNAENWATAAPECGFPVDQIVMPGDIAVFSVGHVAYVESVNSDGTFNVSERNWGCPSGQPGCDGTRQRLTIDNGVGFIHHRPDQPMKPEWIPSSLKEELELRETRILEYGSYGQIKFKVNSGGKFQVRLDKNTVLEGDGSGETNWLKLGPGKHTVQFWVQRFRVGFLDPTWQPDYWQSIIGRVFAAESSPEPVAPKPITPSAIPPVVTPSISSVTWTPTHISVQPPPPTNHTPNNFRLIAPFDNQQFPNGVVPNLQWQATTDPDGDSIKYKVVIRNAAAANERQPGERDEIPSPSMTETNWQPSGQGLEIGGRYTWRVFANDERGGETPSMDEWTFTIAPRITPTPTPTQPCDRGANRPPDQFNLLSPADKSQSSTNSLPLLQWQSTTDPNCDSIRYQVIIDNATSPDGRRPGEPPQVKSDWLTTNNWTPNQNDFKAGGRYTWYVIADDNRGGQTGSKDHWSFTLVVQTQPPSATTASPTNTPTRPVSVSTSTNTLVRPTSTPTSTNTPIPPPPTATLPICPPGTGPGPTVYKARSYDPAKLTQQERQWLYNVFETPGIAPVGYGGKDCR